MYYMLLSIYVNEYIPSDERVANVLRTRRERVARMFSTKNVRAYELLCENVLATGAQQVRNTFV